MFKLFSICSLIISMLFTGVTQSPINMAAISCPVNFELLNGTIMDNNKLIINAKKTVKKETPKKETKKTKKPTPSKTKTTTKKEQENNTINLAGTILGISNEATQERLDKKYKEFVNWGSQYTENKLVDLALFAGKLTGLFYKDYKPNKILNKLSVGYYNKGYTTKNE